MSQYRAAGSRPPPQRSSSAAAAAASSTQEGRPRHSQVRSSSAIPDLYPNLHEVYEALQSAGLESSNLIVGIDFTRSNEWTGERSFGGLNLHTLGEKLNPYQEALSIIGRTLYPFDEDALIPCLGFGDSTTKDRQVFSFNPDHSPCRGLEEALTRYKAMVPHLKLDGPTSFVPIINAAVDIVDDSGGKHHILIIIADGQIESEDVRATTEAIVAASHSALSIVLVGVGDGPWELMHSFDDSLTTRVFDNFQFVNFTEIKQRKDFSYIKDAVFAKLALMEVPTQFKKMRELGILGQVRSPNPTRVKPLTPPLGPPTPAPPPVHQFTVREINAAIGPDRILLGKGGFGQVFRGVLPPNQTKIAVKQLVLNKREMASFRAELKTLEKARHKNLITLLGFCETHDSLWLVYEFMPNLSLEKWIYVVDAEDRPLENLTWPQRLQVIKGLCAALLYLHFQCIDRRPILHLDIKPANILLSDSFEAKLGDFGLARIISQDYHNTTSTFAENGGGTPGYMAPEVPSGINSVRSDVYSFGVVLLEIVRGRKYFQWRRRPNEFPYFHYWAQGRRDVEIFKELDSSITGFHQRTAEKLMRMGLRCAQQQKEKRPSMQEIDRELVSLLDSSPN